MASCVFYLVSCEFLFLRGVLPCSLMTRPQGGLGAPSSLSRMRSPEPRVVDADPISVVPGGAEDLVRDHPQIDLAPGGPETSGA
jgi:hypothetical protein